MNKECCKKCRKTSYDGMQTPPFCGYIYCYCHSPQQTMSKELCNEFIEKDIRGNVYCAEEKPCKTHSPQPQDWEKRLWDLLYEEYGDAGKNGTVKDFITNLLQARTKEIQMGVVPKEMKVYSKKSFLEHRNQFNQGFNEAIKVINQNFSKL